MKEQYKNVTTIRDLTQGGIFRQLFSLALPLLAISFIQMAYNLVDLLWIGRLGSEAVAACLAAITQYLKAAKQADDAMLSPIYYKKAGEAYLYIGNYDKAIENFTHIKETYISAPEGQEADKYIKQAELLKGAN